MTKYRPSAYSIAAILFIAGCFILLFIWIFAVYHIYKQYKQDPAERPWLSVLITPIIFFTLTLLCGIIDTTHLWLCWSDNPDGSISMEDSDYNILTAINDFIYFSIDDFFNIILFLRLYFVFKESYFRLNKSTIIFFIALIILSISINAFNTFLKLYDHDTFNKPVLISYVILSLMNDMIISVTLMVLFIYKLHKLMKLSIYSSNIFKSRSRSSINTHASDLEKDRDRIRTVSVNQYLPEKITTNDPEFSLSKSPLLMAMDNKDNKDNNKDKNASLARSGITILTMDKGSDLATRITILSEGSEKDIKSTFQDSQAAQTIFDLFKVQSLKDSNITQPLSDGTCVEATSPINYLIVMTRYSILYTFAICFNQIYYQLVILDEIHDAIYEDDISLFINIKNQVSEGILIFGGRLFGTIGMSICILLSMQYAKKGYLRICWCCHLACFKCLQCCT